MAKSRKPKKPTRQGKQKQPLRSKGRGGRFLSKEDKDYQAKERAEREKDLEYTKELDERTTRQRKKQKKQSLPWTPKGERKSRRSKQKTKAARVETKTRAGKYVKQTLSIKANLSDAIEQARDFLVKNAKGKKARSWINIGKGRLWYGSKVGSTPASYYFLTTRGQEYEAKLGIEAETPVTIEVVVIKKAR